jgi:predicted amidohydrolase
MPAKRAINQPIGLPESYVTIEGLYQAYRKAKVDTFFERGLCMESQFVEFEKNLQARLKKVHEMLLTGSWVGDENVFGEVTFIPKELVLHPGKQAQTGGSFVCKTIHTDPTKAWEEQTRDLRPEAKFRPIAQPSVEWTVISAFWIMKAGWKLDGCLSSAVRGSRLRTYKNGDYHDSALGSFAHYAPAYNRWREDGLKAIRRELDDQKGCVALTADLRSFYHSVDSSFLEDENFTKLIKELEEARDRSKPDEDVRGMKEVDWTFTSLMGASFKAWARHNKTSLGGKVIGLPIGLGAARVVANLSLLAFDRFIQREVQPLYYGRYVDDVFLVLPDSKGLGTGNDVWRRIAKLSEIDESKSCGVKLEREAAKGREMVCRLYLNYDFGKGDKPLSDLRFAGAKQKSFFIDGAGGRALLETIEDQIRQNSSEWRKLPVIPSFDDDFHILTHTGESDSNEAADSLRKADRVSIRRLRFAFHLRDLEAIAEDLEPSLWADARSRLYSFAECQLLVLPEFFVYAEYVPRIFGLAVCCRDWEAALNLIKRIEVLFRQISKICKGRSAKLRAERCRGDLMGKLKCALCRALPWDDKKFPRFDSGFQKIMAQLERVPEFLVGEYHETYQSLAKQFYFRDLGRVPFKNSVLAAQGMATADRFSANDFPGDTADMLRFEDLEGFVGSVAGKLEGVPAAMVFPTRPLLPAEIGLLKQSLLSAEGAEDFGKYVRAVRGSHFKAIDSGKRGQLRKWFPDEAIEEVLWIPEAEFSTTVRIALPCISLDDESWAASIVQRKDPVRERYTRITRLLNEILGSEKRPHYIVLPELALKEHWFNRFAAKLEKSGISLMSGVEYRHHPFEGIGSDMVVNSVRVSMVTRYPGYRTHLLYSQNKQRPAPGERTGLTAIGGKQLSSGKSKRMIVRHGEFQFGILICSELSDIQARAKLRGLVDALFVPEWNTDTGGFASLVEATALDLHCFVIQSNNRKYGDSRIRAPFKKSHARDVVRLNGGCQDFHAAGEIDFKILRRFQSNHHSVDKEFKPVPDGFELHASRQELPLVP